MNLSGKKREEASEGGALAGGWTHVEDKPSPLGTPTFPGPALLGIWGPRWGAHPAAPHPYVDPHIGDLLIHDVRLDVPRHCSGEGHPLLLILGGGDEQGWREQDELEPLLGPIQEHSPGAERARGERSRRPQSPAGGSRVTDTSLPKLTWDQNHSAFANT